MMLKAALQNVRDSSIHENSTSVGLHTLLVRMVRDVRLAGHVVRYGGTDLRVRAKPFALKRAIGNLLDNALHYGEEVEINVLTVNEQVAIEVRDRGPGVPDEALAKLFTPYVRLDHGRHRNHGGTGLGLGIARWLVQGMDGDVRLANRAGGGLTATILVPCDTGATESL
ncbi:sensor histidine kinase, partial [Massilia phosphatilytica]